MRWLLGHKTPTLELGGLVGNGKLALAIGIGQREFLTTLAPRLAGTAGVGVERGGGLAQARALTDGCQTCVAIDPVAIADGLLAILAADPDADRSFRRLLDGARKHLRELGLTGQVSIAAKFDATRWEFAVAVPKTLLFLGPDAAERIRESVEQVADGYARLGVPSDEAICDHIKRVLEKQLATAQPSQAEVEKFMHKCVQDLDKEREKIGDASFRRQAKCVVKAEQLEDMMKCEEP